MKAYLPEWKPYLWKKLLLDENDPSRVFQPKDFIYFDEEHQKDLIGRDAQKTIKQLNSYTIDLANGVDVDHGIHTPPSGRYYYFEAPEVMLALIELAIEDPRCLKITDIELGKKVLHDYRQKMKTRLTDKQRKELAVLSITAGLGGQLPKNDPLLVDLFCGLPEYIYNKVDKGEKLTLPNLDILIDQTSDATIFSSLRFKLTIDKKSLQERLNAYIADFMAGELIPPQGVRLFIFEQQKNNILGAIQSLATRYGNKNIAITFEEVARIGGWANKDEHHYRFYETIFSLEQLGEIEIKDLRKEEVVLSLIEKPVVEKEKIPPVKELSAAEKKKLAVLEKLKEEWDLAPKNAKQIELKISGDRAYEWMVELGIDYDQLRNILLSFKEENLIINFESINPAM